MMRLPPPSRGSVPLASNQEAYRVLTRVIERLGLNKRRFLERLADLGYAFSDDDFVNWGRAGRTFPRDWAALRGMVQVVTHNQPPDRRCTATEGLQFLALVGMPFAELHPLAGLFPPAEFAAALTAYIPTVVADPSPDRRTPSSPGASRGGRDGARAPIDGAASPSVSAGLLALTGLTQVPAVHDAIITFRAVFQAACDQISVLVNCKQLHELFQQLEDRYYLTYHDGKRLPDDDLAWASIERIEPELQVVIDDLLDLAAQTALAADTVLWAQKLAHARETLRVAIEDQNPEQLKRALTQLKDVLGREPSRVNARLVSAARALQLSALVQTLTTVRDHLAQLGLHPDVVQRVATFACGVDALAGLDNRLTAAIAVHNTFQALDDELRRVEALLELDVRELEHAWQNLQPMMQQLCNDSSAGWALKFSTLGAELEHTFRAENPSKLRRLFRSYRSQAIRNFNLVDRHLLMLCDELQKVGEPLATVLRMVA